jgi:uncharacterized protein with LGFP repeats
MARQPMRRRRGAARWAIGLLGVATALLLPPVATAQPDVDAANAITAAWQASGGDTGPLGPTNGGVYPIGAGFAQNFASGKVFFTPATGAHLMQGAILDKYEQLGGPADSDLGFPTIDEGPGRAPDSRNSTFSAPDNPVIFWTPNTGAHVVRGPLNAAWDKLGGSSGVLGVPAEDETYDGAVTTQKFTGGQVSYDAREKKFTTDPADLAGQLTDLTIPDDPVAAINAARRAAGGPLGPLGGSDGEPYKIGSDGWGQNFVNGKIFYTPDTGANVVTGQVLAKYESVGGPEGDLGFPITGEVDGGVAPASRMSSFAAADKPVIFWTPDYGAVIVRGAMNAAWQKLGGATGALGVPAADQTSNGDTITQKFGAGAITYDTASKKFSTEPSNLAPQLAGLDVPGEQQSPPDAQASPQAADDDSVGGFRWTWWWLLALVPVLLVIAVAGLLVARNRRRSADDDLFGTPAQPYRDDERPNYEPAPSGGDADEGEDALFGDRYAREGLGSVSALSSGTAAGAGAADGGYAGHADYVEPGDHDGYAEQDDPDAVDTTPTRVPTASELADQPAEPEPVEPDDEEPENVEPEDVEPEDVEPEYDDTQVATGDVEPEPVGPVLTAESLSYDAVTDTGRHARIDVDEPIPMGTALHLPLDDSDEAPDGYPVKADARSGLYWVPGSPDYAEAQAQIWFATEEIARTNGFVRGS